MGLPPHFGHVGGGYMAGPGMPASSSARPFVFPGMVPQHVRSDGSEAPTLPNDSEEEADDDSFLPAPSC